MKKKLCLRIAQDMAEKGMIDGLESEADDRVIAEAINAQAAQLLRMNDDGLYEFEKAVKSASDPDGVEALRKRASRVKPEEGTLQQPMIMRQSATGASRNSLDDPDFFR